jgi:hypothetical protein
LDFSSYLYFFFSFINIITPTGIDKAYTTVIIPNVNQGCVIINDANNATINIIGINIYVGTFIFLVEIVGIRLTIKKETIQSNIAQKVLDDFVDPATVLTKVYPVCQNGQCDNCNIACDYKAVENFYTKLVELELSNTPGTADLAKILNM